MLNLLVVNQNGTTHQLWVAPLRDGSDGNFDTLAVAAAMIREDTAVDPEIRQRAAGLVSACPSTDAACQIRKLFEFAQSVYHIDDPIGVERIADAATTITEGFGDCGDKAILLATLLGALGYVSRFVVISFAGDAAQYGFDHLYLEAQLPDGSWIPLDPDSIYHSAGWEAPAAARVTYPIWQEFELDYSGQDYSDAQQMGRAQQGVGSLGDFSDDILPGLISQGTQIGLQYAGQQAQQAQISGAQESEIGKQWDALDKQVAALGVQLNNRGAAITADEVNEFAAAIAQLEQASQQYSGIAYIAAQWAQEGPRYQEWLSGLTAKVQMAIGGQTAGNGQTAITPLVSSLSSLTTSPYFVPGLIGIAIVLMLITKRSET